MLRCATVRSGIPKRADAIERVFAEALALDGCWTAPIASVQPQGEPRLIRRAVAVESVKNPAIDAAEAAFPGRAGAIERRRENLVHFRQRNRRSTSAHWIKRGTRGKYETAADI